MTIPQLREALKSEPDGATVAQLSRRIGQKPCHVSRALHVMPDVYVDRWTRAKAGPHEYAAVYAIAEIPEDAPYPETRSPNDAQRQQGNS